VNKKKMLSGIQWIVFLVVFYIVCVESIMDEHRPENGVYQFQSSFNGPYGGSIPFWETGGSAIIMENHVRLTPNTRSQRGWIWSTRPLRAKEWELVIQFSVGSEARVGADGLAFWYTKERAQPGPVMGNIDRWTGLGVILDTFDNDGKRDNPQIYAVYNDHTFNFDPSSDGKANTLGSCYANIRQTGPDVESKFAKLLVRMKDKTLYVAYDNSGLVGSGTPGWIDCFTAPINIEDTLSGYYLGITAETGGLSDFHDVKSLSTWSYRPKPNREPIDNSVPNKQEEPKEASKPKKKEERALPTRDRDTVKPKKQDEDPSAEVIANRLLELEKKR
jgi:hypothetical protein